MKKILILFLLVSSGPMARSQKIMHSAAKNITVLIGGRPTDWRISPEENPDRLKVYCSREKNEVIFRTDMDTAAFQVSKNDTIKFSIVLNSKDTAHTEIIGIRDFPDKITREEKLYWFSQVWSETKYNFVNIDRLGFNLDSLYRFYIPQVTATRNDYEYYRLLQKFMASLHDGHTQVGSNGQFYRYTDYIPVSLKDFDHKVYITAVRQMPGQDSTWVGAEITEIDHLPTIQYLERDIFPYISASTEQHMWMQAIYDIQSDFKDHPFRATIKKRDGTIVNIELQRNGEEIRTKNDRNWGTVPEYSRNVVDFKWMDNQVAFVSFNRFMPEKEAMEEFDRIAKELYNAKGLIIDLRKNGGGSTEVAWHLQRYLTQGNFFLNYGWETRINDGVKKANGNWQEEYKDYFLNKAYRFEKPDTVPVPDTLRRITCPVIILIGRYTFSAAEDFLVNLYEVPGRPRFVGEETGGSTGSPLVINGLPGGGYARICTRRICFPISGKRFVNTGIKPDIEVKQTMDDYLRGRDAVLDRAVMEISTTPVTR